MQPLPWLLRRMVRSGSLTLIGPDGSAETFGGLRPGPQVTMRITVPSFGWRFLRSPELAVPETYMEGGLSFEGGSLGDLIELYRVNRVSDRLAAEETLWDKTRKTAWRAARRVIAYNNPLRSRRNAAAHYDIGNDLYRLFLDADMQYSCGYFPRGDETLDEAQLLKKRHIAAKLMLRPGQRVLDIGCGWGGMALYLAKVADVEVLGITLAEEQLKIARERAAEAGLADRVRFELRDYRTVTGEFDRIVSVGMMEHVGLGALDTYFQNVQDRLAPDGIALIHSIMRMSQPVITDPFTLKYIFPGGYIPTLSDTFTGVESSGLWLQDCEIWRLHYARTLRPWYDRFMANRDAARGLYDERFCRMWETYLLGSESAFRIGRLAVMQLQLARTRDAVPLNMASCSASLNSPTMRFSPFQSMG